MDLSVQTLERARRVLTGDAPAYEAVSRLYTIADLMEETDGAVGACWKALEASGRSATVEATLTDYDFLMRAKALRKLADEWQDKLDAEGDDHDEDDSWVHDADMEARG